jgi:hypothetical protein
MRTKARRDGGARGGRLLTSGQRQRHVAHLRVLAHARRPEARCAPVTAKAEPPQQRRTRTRAASLV